MNATKEGHHPHMRQLKKFAVVPPVRKTDVFKAASQQPVSIAEDEPDELTEFEGMVDFHWGSIRTRRPNGWRIRSKRFRTNQKSSSCVCPVTMTFQSRFNSAGRHKRHLRGGSFHKVRQLLRARVQVRVPDSMERSRGCARDRR
jgi:hypothetical protein